MKFLALAPFLGLGLLAGIALSLQAGVNNSLREQINSPYAAALVSFMVGSLVLLLVVTFGSSPRPSWQVLVSMPRWLWLGGLLGAMGVAISIMLASRLGAVNLTIVIVCGQLLASMVLDHFGWIGFERHPVNWQRLTGVVMVLGGLLLTAKY